MSLEGIQERKNKVKQMVLFDHPGAKDMHTYVSNNSTKYKDEFMKAYHYKCAYCGVSLDLIPKGIFEIDHFIHRKADCFASKKDAGTMDNLVLACRDCNSRKRDFAIDKSNENDLRPDRENIINNYSRDKMFYIVLTESGKSKKSVVQFYKQLCLGSEIHRIDYLVMSMIGLQNRLKDKGDDCAELENAINILRTKRNIMTV